MPENGPTGIKGEMSYFVTGTDTGVGKTLVSCGLLRALARQGKKVSGFKPVAAGCEADGRNEDVERLLAASTQPLAREQVNPYCFIPPIAPHLAAAQAGTRIALAPIVSACQALAAQVDSVVVEGAGGFLVPLNESETLADLARALAFPVILVVGIRLGCLNHALLTAEAIAARGLTLAGWVANQMEPAMPAVQENLDTLRTRLAAPLLGVVPHLAAPWAEPVRLDLDLLREGV